MTDTFKLFENSWKIGIRPAYLAASFITCRATFVANAANATTSRFPKMSKGICQISVKLAPTPAT